MSEENNNTSNSFLKKAWYLFFILLYPVLVTFSLVFTGILFLFSGISKVIFKIVSMFSAKAEDGRITPEVKPTIHPPSAHS